MNSRLQEREAHKGRGAVTNPAGRYEKTTTSPVDDGWDTHEQDLIEHPATDFFPDKTKNLIATNRSPDIPFDQSINSYKGCEHGCIYCFARPTHAFLGLSPGLDFETKIYYKTDVVARLKEALDKPGYVVSPIAMGTNTDPYQPGERRYEVTRKVLQTLLEYRHPVTVLTKSGLVLRDLDLLSELARNGLVSVGLSVTTLDKSLKAKLEPRTASPQARLKAISQLAAANIPVSAMAAPIIPYINDHELEAIVDACVDAGAHSVNYILLRLPLEVKDLFYDWLKEHFPLKAEHVMNRIRDTRRGLEYRSAWGTRMRGEGVYAELLSRRFEQAIKKHASPQNGEQLQQDENRDIGLLRTDLFRPQFQQLNLF